MRPDMKYVVIESGRRGGYGKHNRTRPRHKGEEWEGYLKHEGIRLPHGYNTKYQTDLLGPLWGYLRKHVGKPWDVVYADICRHLDFRSVLGFHIKSHLFDGFGGVQRHVQMRGRVPYERIGRFGSPPAAVDGFWVHPRTGLLLEQRARRRPSKPAAPITRKIVDEWTQIHRLHGAWFEVELAPYAGIVPCGDAVVRAAGDPRADFARLYGRPGVYATRKRQLSKKETTRHGLSETKG
jgi:hypothetical protein